VHLPVDKVDVQREGGEDRQDPGDRDVPAPGFELLENPTADARSRCQIGLGEAPISPPLSHQPAEFSTVSHSAAHDREHIMGYTGENPTLPMIMSKGWKGPQSHP
jgi:hypothetical protein